MHSQVDQHEMVKLREAQRILNIGRSTMHDLIKSGDLPAKKIRNEWHIKGENLKKWLQTHQEEKVLSEDVEPFQPMNKPTPTYIGDWT